MDSDIPLPLQLPIVEHFPANTPLEPLSETGFVWLYVKQCESTAGGINNDNPVWIKMKISNLVATPVYNQQNLVTIQTEEDPNGIYLTAYSGIAINGTVLSPAFTSISVNNFVFTITALGVLPPPAKATLDLYVQHATLAPQVPQVSSSDLLAEIIRRQTNPQDTRKLPENVTITIGKFTIVNNNFSCVKKHCKKCKHEH